MLSQQEKAETQLCGLGTITVYILLYWVVTKIGKKLEGQYRAEG